MLQKSSWTISIVRVKNNRAWWGTQAQYRYPDRSEDHRQCLNEDVETAKAMDYDVIITADHGNADGTPASTHVLSASV